MKSFVIGIRAANIQSNMENAKYEVCVCTPRRVQQTQQKQKLIKYTKKNGIKATKFGRPLHPT